MMGPTARYAQYLAIREERTHGSSGKLFAFHPPWQQIPFAHALIEAGADLVFGHSAHVFRGVEVYHDRPILYSAGDFVDDYAVDPGRRNDRSFLFVIELAEGALRRLKIYPTVIREFQACLAQGPEAEEIAGKMIRLCRDFGTPAEWHEHEHCLEIPVERDVPACSKAWAQA